MLFLLAATLWFVAFNLPALQLAVGVAWVAGYHGWLLCMNRYRRWRRDRRNYRDIENRNKLKEVQMRKSVKRSGLW